MSERIPNHKCKACGKEYYACPDCDRYNSWRAVACSPECYNAYTDAVINSRKANPDCEKAVGLDEGSTQNQAAVEATKVVKTQPSKKKKTQ